MKKLNKIEKEELIQELTDLGLKWLIKSATVFHMNDNTDKLIVDRYFELCRLLNINVVELTGIVPEDIIFDEDYYLFPDKWNSVSDCYDDACEQYRQLITAVDNCVNKLKRVKEELTPLSK